MHSEWILIFIGIDGTEGKVLSCSLTFGQDVEKGRLPEFGARNRRSVFCSLQQLIHRPDIRQTHNPHFQVSADATQ